MGARSRRFESCHPEKFRGDFLRKYILAILVLLSVSFPAFAAESSGTDERSNAYIKNERASTLLEQASTTASSIERRQEKTEDERITILVGGALSSQYRYYKNIDNQKSREDFLRWSWAQLGSVYLYMNVDKHHDVLVQMTDYYISRGVGQEYSGVGDDNTGPLVSLAYYKLTADAPLDSQLNVTVGRQYLKVGRGIAYSSIDDGISSEWKNEHISLQFLLSHSKPREDNLDYSVPGYEKEGDRSFIGGQVVSSFWKNLPMYAFYVSSKDDSSENTDSGAQIYHYDADYYGAGLSATLNDVISLWSEFIWESANGFTDDSRTRLMETDVNAYMTASGAKFALPLYAKPTIELLYARATGDDDHTNVTNIIGGDLDGNDSNFLYYGNFQAGYALQPRLSNIEVYQVSGSVQPLEFLPLFNKFALGSKFYWYRKENETGGTSDLESTLKDDDIGTELNAFVHWKIYDHLLVSVRYGIFYPGDAFPEATRDNTEYFLSSVTLSF